MNARMTLPLLTIVAATNSTGCYSTWDLAPNMLVRLDGFSEGETRKLEAINHEEVVFTKETKLQFSGTDGLEDTVQFRSLRLEGRVLIGIEQKSGQQVHIDLRRIGAVQAANFSPGDTGLATAGFLAGMVPVGMSIAFGILFPFLSTGEGRPLRVAGRRLPVPARLVRARAAGRHARPSHTNDATVARLFARWAKAASDECASIPAFLALARDLDKASAPTNLVRATLQAAREEANHTRLCTTLANDYSTTPIAAVTPSIPMAVDGDCDSLLERLALEAFWDGCIAEGAAAAVARRSAKLAQDEATRLALQTIAHDETNHARLAEYILAFCLSKGGRRIRNTLMESFERRRAAEQAQLDAPNADVADASFVDHDFARKYGLAENDTTRAARIETWEKSAAMLARVNAAISC